MWATCGLAGSVDDRLGVCFPTIPLFAVEVPSEMGRIFGKNRAGRERGQWSGGEGAMKIPLFHLHQS
jgi:hypothetical protein